MDDQVRDETLRLYERPRDEPMAAALAYAARGWRVVPLHHVKDGVCSCAAGPSCRWPGAHALDEIEMAQAATTDALAIEASWSAHPSANVGIVAGPASRLAVVIVDEDLLDPRHQTVIDAIARSAPIIRRESRSTAEYLFELTEESDGGHLLAPGLDVATGDLLVVAPPSRLAHGSVIWDGDITAPLPPLPALVRDAPGVIDELLPYTTSSTTAVRTMHGRDATTPAPTPTSMFEPVIERASSVQATAVDWEIPSLIPSAAVVMFTGLPGIGKSTVLADLIARVTTGANAPASDSPMRAGACIVLCREDDRATTIVPRLAAAGADLERVVFVDQVRIPQTGDTRELRLPFDVAAIERAVIQERARWVVIDPLSDYLVNVDTNSEHDVRRALLPLVRLAQDHRVTVIFVQHMTKRDHSTALLRGVGSIAFGAVVRAAVLVDMTEAGLVMRSVKSNLGPKAPPLGFDLVGEPGQPAARVVWRTVNAAPVEKETAVDRAKTFLLEHVTVDGVLAREINARARALGIGMTNLRAAKALLGVVSVPPGGPTARWVLPTNHANDAAPNGARRVDVMTAPSSEAR